MNHPTVFGQVIDHGYDADGYQRKEKCTAVAECLVCGKDVLLISDTEAWTQRRDGHWRHSEYGPGAGECCERVIVDTFDGCFVLSLKEPKP